jgi:DNA-binding SARP family transcriptional activator
MSLACVQKESAIHNPAPGMLFSFCLLGELTIASTDGRESTPPHRTHGLLATLLLYPQPWRRERLLGLLFPNIPESKGRQRLSNLLWLLRQSLPSLPLETRPQEVHLPPETRWLDVEAFGQAAQGDSLQSWLVALALYRDDLLPGIYDDWLLQEREMLYLQYVSLTHRACDELLRQGRFGETLPLAERLVQRESFDEHALRTLMKAYRALGRRGAALAAYERFVALAADELDVDPDPATQALAEALRSAAPRALAESVADRDIQMATGEDDPEALLRFGQDALARADRFLVEECLRRLRAHPEGYERDARWLEIDLALLFEEYDHAERLLATHPTQEAKEQVQRAQLALGRRDLTQAQVIASEVLMQAHEAGDRESEMWALLTLGQAQQQTGHGAQAMRSAEQALSLARTLAFPQGVATALVLKGSEQIYQGRYKWALSHFYDARSVALEHQLRYHLAKALRGIRRVQSYTHALVDAQATILEELSLWRDLSMASWEAAALEGLAAIQNHLGRPADALRTMRQAHEISKRLGEPSRMAISHYNMAYAYIYLDDSLAAEALVQAKAALESFRTLNQARWVSSTLICLGYIQWIDGQYAAALDYLRQAYSACERVGDLGCLPEVLAYQGLAHLGLGQLVDSLDLTRRAVLALTQGEISEDVVPEIYYAHAMALAADGKQDQATNYFRQAYQRLLAVAAQFEDENARRASFYHNPTMRRLMRELRERGIAPEPEARVVRAELPAARAGRSVQVRWTLDAGPADTALKQSKGAVALRRARLARLMEEAELQGAAPTVANLAAVLGVSKRTIQRDLVALRH